MKTIIVFCMLLMALPVFAGTYRDDFENEQDFINDCNNGIWIEDINLFTWENGYVKTESPGGAGLTFGDLNWKDYIVECKVKPVQISPNSFGFGLALRRPCIQCGTIYYLGINEKYAGIYLNLDTPINDSPFELELGKWYSLKGVAQGDQFEFYVDGKPMAKAKDDNNQTGRVGFVVFGSAYFDDFIVTGSDVKDEGHWNPKSHEQLAVVNSQGKIIETWGKIKNNQ
jgi:hypothetical protein